MHRVTTRHTFGSLMFASTLSISTVVRDMDFCGASLVFMLLSVFGLTGYTFPEIFPQSSPRIRQAWKTLDLTGANGSEFVPVLSQVARPLRWSR